MARILLAEDDEIMRITILDRLKKNNWQVDEAKDGKEALSLAEHNYYNLVLSDIRMPGLDGTLLLNKIQRISSDTDIIMMTAYGSVENAVDCLKKGAADYIVKPFDMDDLTIRIKRLLEMHQVITVERVMTLIGQIAEVIKQHVKDQHTLNAITADFGRLISVEPHREAAGEKTV